MGKKQRLFGTDGIRGIINQWPLGAPFVLKIGQAIAQVLLHEDSKPVVVIGRDPRLSGYMLESALTAGLTSQGVDTMLAGIITTPGVAFLTRQHQAQLGIVISASHNPFDHNGIKLFGTDGFKLADEKEREIEQWLLDDDAEPEAVEAKDLGRSWDASPWRQSYVDHLVKTWHTDCPLQGKRIVLDCANGATSEIAPQVFRRLGADLVLMEHTPDGVNINQNYEYIYPAQLRSVVLDEKADAGVAFDGDGDRLIMVDDRGNFLDGDTLMALLARGMKAKGQLRGSTLVATPMSNLGLHRSLARLGIQVEETKVGDRHVLQRMLEQDYVLGGEQSGHIIILQAGQTTGDGIYTALAVLQLLMEANTDSLADLAAWVLRFPNVLVNRPVVSRPPLTEIRQVEEEIERLRSLFGADLDVNFRYSGTENLLRLKLRSADDRCSEKELAHEATVSAAAVHQAIEQYLEDGKKTAS